MHDFETPGRRCHLFAHLLISLGLAACAGSDKALVVDGETTPCVGDIRGVGEASPAFAEFEATIQDYMVEYTIPNGNVAFMTADDELVLNRSYTYSCGGEIADGHRTEAPESTTPASRFRIGSISKLLTATAVHALAEDAAFDLALTDRLVDHIDLTPSVDLDGDAVVQTPDEQIVDITVLNALQHRTGWNCRDETKPHHMGDPSAADFRIVDTHASAGVDVSLPIGLEHIIGYTASHPLAHRPGTTKNYCSVGYIMAAEIVAAVTDLPYVDVVTDRVLHPAGMTATQPGRTRVSDRLPDEVRYADHSPSVGDSVMDEGERVARPYGASFNIENRLASGGWVATASDLTAFGRAFLRGDLVSDPAEIMAANRGWPDHFAKREGSTGHTGSMQGSHAILMCFGADDENPLLREACWSFLFNKSPPRDIPHPLTGEEVEPRDLLSAALANEVLPALTEL